MALSPVRESFSSSSSHTDTESERGREIERERERERESFPSLSPINYRSERSRRGRKESKGRSKVVKMKISLSK